MESLILLLAVFFAVLACVSACISVAQDLWLLGARKRIHEDLEATIGKLRLEAKIRRGE